MGKAFKNQATTEIDEQKKQHKIAMSKVNTNCFSNAAKAISELHGHGQHLDVLTLMDVLISSSNRVKDGNLIEVEQMLMTQAKALDYVFYDALQKLSDLNMVNQIQIFTEIAFKAQTQCRKTLTVLAELKHPRRATFIKQQNNAINQQINQVSETEKIENNKKLKNKVVSEVALEKMDNRRTCEAIPAHTSTTTIPLFDRSTNTRGKSQDTP